MWDSIAGEIIWVVIGAIAIAAIFFRYRAGVSRDRAIQALAEKGLSIPRELLPAQDLRNPVRTGITLICVGIALFVFLFAMTRSSGPINDQMHNAGWLPFAGLFPFSVGVAFLIGEWVTRRNDRT